MLTKEGVEALLKVKAQKLSEPESLDMRVWIQTETDTPCGTVSCIAGQLIINKFIEEDITSLLLLKGLTFESSVFQAAYQILGFTKDERNIPLNLFHREHWPDNFYYDYAKAASNSKKRAEILGQVIDWFIETNYKPEGVTENA